MSRDDPYVHAALVAERVVREHDITALKGDPIELANKMGIEVRGQALPRVAESSGMLIRFENQFGIAYATFIRQPGVSAVSASPMNSVTTFYLRGISMPFSRTGIFMSVAPAGFNAADKWHEIEADHFAARLLMPDALFSSALRRAGEGLAAVEQLPLPFARTSLTATAIRYAQCSHDPCGDHRQYRTTY